MPNFPSKQRETRNSDAQAIDVYLSKSTPDLADTMNMQMFSNRLHPMSSGYLPVLAPAPENASSPMQPMVPTQVTPASSSCSSVTSAVGSGNESTVSSSLSSVVTGSRPDINVNLNLAAMYGNNPQPYVATAAAAVSGGVQAAYLLGAAATAAHRTSGMTPHTPHHPIAEFLYQLTKMLTDDNSEMIEWRSGRIHVHDPQKLADEVLDKYFRHSKYSSFQRQLNYFGFRKIAGKGKMSPCHYVNEAATEDIRSLLFIKRKTSSGKAQKGAVSNTMDSKAEKKRKGAPGNLNAMLQQQIGFAGPARGVGNSVPSTLAQLYANYASIAQRQQQQQQQQQQMLAAGNPAFSAPSGLRDISGSPATTFSSTTPATVQPASTISENFLFPREASQNNFATQGGHMQQQKQQDISYPATSAMNAASASNLGGGINSLFESSNNLTSLLKDDNCGVSGTAATSQLASHLSGQLPSQTSSAFLSSLSSSGTLFPDNLSCVSLNQLVQAQNRGSGGTTGLQGQGSAAGVVGGGTGSTTASQLNELGNCLSREDSLLDLAMGMPSGPSALQL